MLVYKKSLGLHEAVKFRMMMSRLRRWGIDVDSFDKRSRKNLLDLYWETHEKEVVLTYERETGRVVRSPLTVWILVWIPSESVYLCEVRREYRNGKVVWGDDRRRSVRGTRRRGELAIAAVVREVFEELGLKIDPRSFIQHVLPFEDQFPKYESTAYQGIWTYAYVEYFELILKSRPFPWKETPDNGIKLRFEWRPY